MVLFAITVHALVLNILFATFPITTVGSLLIVAFVVTLGVASLALFVCRRISYFCLGVQNSFAQMAVLIELM